MAEKDGTHLRSITMSMKESKTDSRRSLRQVSEHHSVRRMRDLPDEQPALTQQEAIPHRPLDPRGALNRGQLWARWGEEESQALMSDASV